jgi:Na+/melibiose symporter-like transporter
MNDDNLPQTPQEPSWIQDKNKITHKQYVTRTTLIKVITALYIIGVMVALVIVAPLISLMGSLGNVLSTFFISVAIIVIGIALPIIIANKLLEKVRVRYNPQLTKDSPSLTTTTSNVLIKTMIALLVGVIVFTIAAMFYAAFTLK